MTKRLNVTSITNELAESAFFPSKKTQPPSPAQPSSTNITPLDQSKHIKTDRPTIEPKQQEPERPNARTFERTVAKRIITRNSFEIYEDQMDSLRRISFKEKMDGKIGSMSRMVREAIEQYLKHHASDE